MHFLKVPFAMDRPLTKGRLVKSYGHLHYYELDLRALGAAWSWVEVDKPIPLRPHRDHGISVALNIYFETGDGLTSFYDGPEEGEAYEGETLKNIYKFNELTKVSEFRAVRGDAFLLDVSQIHSVTELKGPRSFIQASWSSYSLLQIAQHLIPG